MCLTEAGVAAGARDWHEWHGPWVGALSEPQLLAAEERGTQVVVDSDCHAAVSAGDCCWHQDIDSWHRRTQQRDHWTAAADDSSWWRGICCDDDDDDLCIVWCQIDFYFIWMLPSHVYLRYFCSVTFGSLPASQFLQVPHHCRHDRYLSGLWSGTTLRWTSVSVPCLPDTTDKVSLSPKWLTLCLAGR